jgi:hypothetical protein
MLEDNLTKQKLQEMIGAARFNTAGDFKEFLKEKLIDNFDIDNERFKDESSASEERHDILIFDELTEREAIVVIGLKVVAKTPKISQEDIQKFHAKCKEALTLYGVLTTETETHFFRYRYVNEEVFIDEIKELEPLNHIDYEAEKSMDKRKLTDLFYAHIKLMMAIGIFLIFLLSIALAKVTACKTTGPILGEIDKDGVKVYYLQGDTGYDNIVTGDTPGERRFCEEKDAIRKGFIHFQSK